MNLIVINPKLFLTLIILIFNPIANASHWSYNDQQSWANSETECGGMNQSPINVKTEDVHYNQSLRLLFYNYDIPIISFTAKNNGHSVQFDYTGDILSAPGISGTAVERGHFKLAQFHFHWGSAKHVGSEHKVNNRAYPVELHLVHYNADKHDNLNDALKAKDGSVAVLGVFLEISTHNMGFDEIGEIITKSQNNDKKSQLQNPIILDQLFPSRSPQQYFRYHGSLTTPPCTEGVLWLLLHKPGHIGRAQFEKFLGVVNPSNNEKLANNFRKVQNLNGRLLESSFDIWNIDHEQHLAGSSSKSFSNFKQTSSSIVNTILIIVFICVYGLYL